MKGDVMPLTGIVEIDETYVGGKARNMHASKRKDLVGTKNKVAVIGAIARKGMIVAKVIENTDTATLDSFVRQSVSNRPSWSRPTNTADTGSWARIRSSRR